MENYMGEQRVRYWSQKVQARSGAQGQKLLIKENMTLLDRLNLYETLPTKDQN
jgi:hypothetical protein